MTLDDLEELEQEQEEIRLVEMKDEDFINQFNTNDFLTTGE